MSNPIVDFFNNGGIFLFNEENGSSENTYYKIEELMGEMEGENITQTEVDDEGILCIFYDCTVLEEEVALAKYNDGEYVESL